MTNDKAVRVYELIAQRQETVENDLAVAKTANAPDAVDRYQACLTEVHLLRLQAKLILEEQP